MFSNKEFYNYVKCNIADFFTNSADKKITISEILKNNQTTMTGLIIRSEEQKLSPILYLETYYQQYCEGKSLEELIVEIVNDYESLQVNFDINLDQLSDYKKIRSSLFVCLVNYERNKEKLKNCPYERIEDLAITYRWIASQDKNGIASALVRNEDIKKWRVSKEQIKKDAMENTPKILPLVIQNLQDVIGLSNNEGNLMIFILTNTHFTNGASVILYDKVLKNFADKMNTNLYILPSSIHEVLLILERDIKNYREGMEGLVEIVKTVNQTSVAPEEILSDNIYYYDREKDSIRIASI